MPNPTYSRVVGINTFSPLWSALRTSMLRLKRRLRRALSNAALTILVYRSVAFRLFDQRDHPRKRFPLTFYVMRPSNCSPNV